MMNILRSIFYGNHQYVGGRRWEATVTGQQWAGLPPLWLLCLPFWTFWIFNQPFSEEDRLTCCRQEDELLVNVSRNDSKWHILTTPSEIHTQIQTDTGHKHSNTGQEGEPGLCNIGSGRSNASEEHCWLSSNFIWLEAHQGFTRTSSRISIKFILTFGQVGYALCQWEMHHIRFIRISVFSLGQCWQDSPFPFLLSSRTNRGGQEGAWSTLGGRQPSRPVRQHHHQPGGHPGMGSGQFTVITKLRSPETSGREGLLQKWTRDMWRHDACPQPRQVPHCHSRQGNNKQCLLGWWVFPSVSTQPHCWSTPVVLIFIVYGEY